MKSQIMSQTAQAARETTAKIKTAASDTVARAKDEAGRMAEQRKEQTADRVGGYGEALHESARSFENQDPNIAWFAHRMADRIQGAADYVRTSDFSRIRADTEDVARRHPAAFFGGLFVAGLVLGNVLKASRSTSTSDSDTEDDWPETAAGGGDFPPGTVSGDI